MDMQIGFRDIDEKVSLTWELVSRGTVVICDYLDPILIDILNTIPLGSTYPVIFDLHGLWIDVDIGLDDLARLQLGIDIPINVFMPPDGVDPWIYLDLVTDSLCTVAGLLGFPYTWRQMFRSLVSSLWDREGYLNNELIVSELEVLRNEASGYEKSLYNMLYVFLKPLIFEGGVRRLYYVDEPIRLDRLVDGPSILSFAGIPGLYNRLLPYLVIIHGAYLLGSRHVGLCLSMELFAGHLMPLHYHLLNYGIMNGATPVIHMGHLRLDFLYRLPVYNLVVANSRLFPLWSRVGFDPMRFDDYSTHQFLSVGRLLPIRVVGGLRRLEYGEEVVEGGGYEPDESLAREILARVRDVGGLGLEGIYMYLVGVDRRDVYMAVDWLWRNGYLRRERVGGGYVYRVTVKGLMWLRGGDDG